MQDDPVRKYILELLDQAEDRGMAADRDLLLPLLDNNAEAAATLNTYIANLWSGPRREEGPRGPAEGLNRTIPGRARRRAAKYARAQYLYDNRRSYLATCILEGHECNRPSDAPDMDKITKSGIRVNGEDIPCIGPNETFKYLGFKISPNGIANMELSSKSLERLKKAPLKPYQKQEILRTCLIPRFIYRLQSPCITPAFLEKVGKMIRRTLKTFLHFLHLCSLAMPSYILIVRGEASECSVSGRAFPTFCWGVPEGSRRRGTP